LFFLSHRLLLTSILFPYTTLFRSSVSPTLCLETRRSCPRTTAAHLQMARWPGADLPFRLDRPAPGQALPSTFASRSIPRCLQRSDRKSTRLNSSHSQISYAVFCLK